MKVPHPRVRGNWGVVRTAIVVAVLALVLVLTLLSWDNSTTRSMNSAFLDPVQVDLPAIGAS